MAIYLDKSPVWGIMDVSLIHHITPKRKEYFMVDYDKVQFDILTMVQSIKPSDSYLIPNDQSKFGLSFGDLCFFILEMNKQGWFSGCLTSAGAHIGPLTLSGRQRLEELRLILWNRTWYMRTLHWLKDIWWIHVPVFFTALDFYFNVLKSILDFFNLDFLFTF